MKYAVVAAVVCALCFAAVPAAHADQIVRGVSSTWVARDGDLTKADPARTPTLLPRYPFPPGYGLPVPGAAPVSLPAPMEPYFNWADVNGVDWATPIRDQGQCGSCFVFGSVSVMESMFKILLGEPTYNPDLSEQKVIACTSLGSCASGGTAEGVGAHLKSLGTPDEECHPYTSGNTGTDGDCNAKCADWQARASTIADWKMSVLPPTVDQLKTQLKDGSTTSPMKGPVIVNLQIYNDFYKYKSGVYSRSSSATAVGWHIVTLLGWDDGDDSWIIKNSWDTTWGTNGYGRMSRAADCTNFFQTGLCFASHTTYFTVSADQAPSAPCVNPAKSTVQASTLDNAGSVPLTLKNCGNKQPIDWTGKTSSARFSLAAGTGTLAAHQAVPIDVTFNPASLGVGTHEVTATFTSGTSIAAATITVEVTTQPLDGGTPDAGTLDAGTVNDTGTIDDTGTADGGPTDIGSVDGGPTDAGTADAGQPMDAGTPDAGTIEDDSGGDAAAVVDAGAPDDTGATEDGAVTADGGEPADAGTVVDAEVASDAAVATDAGTSPADAAESTDAGSAGEPAGCSCAVIGL